ncbi:MAG: hypothetical protein U0176_07895, partial [Bacteroidia bacterium]
MHIPRIGMVMVIAMLLSVRLLGQAVLVVSDKKPKDPAPNTWWWSQEAHTLKLFVNEKWRYAH